MNFEIAAHAIVEIGKRLYQKNLLAAADGNISCRLEDGTILITPSGMPKGFITIDDLALISQKGEVIKGRPSSETPMHLQIFNSCFQAKFVIHAHPPTAVAWSIAFPQDTSLPSSAMSEMILALGELPIVPYARPGTADMATNLLPYLPKRRAMVLARHGALSWGETMQEALNGMERIEHCAQMLYLAKQLGGITHLPQDEMNYLKQCRERLGDKNL